VQVLGVDDQHQEAEHHADLEQDADGLECLVGVVAERLQHLGHRLRRERLVAVREDAGVHLRAAVQEQRPHDVEDHEQDQPGRAGVRPVEPGPALLAPRGLRDADRGERGQRDQDGDAEEVLEEPERRPVTDHRDGEVAVEQRPVGLEDGGGQHDEGPEGEEVRHAGHRPLQQLALAEHLAQLVLGAGPDAVQAAGRRLAGADQPVQVVHAAAGDRERGQRHDQPDGESHGSSRVGGAVSVGRS
jgi:hypothetical protein